MSDSECLQRFVRENSQSAFAALVERHVGLVYSAALRQVRSPQLAEEIAQSAFLDLSRRAARLDPNQPLAAWLYLVTRRTAVDVIRRESRRLARESTAAEIAVMKETPPHAWSHVERSLDDAMETLNETERTAILLRYFQNKSLREVGAALGLSDDAAQKRVSRAVEQLRTFFLRRGIAITGAGLAGDLSAHAQQAAPAGAAAAITLRALAPAAGSAAGAAPALSFFLTMKTALVALTALLLLGLAWTWQRTPATAPPKKATSISPAPMVALPPASPLETRVASNPAGTSADALPSAATPPEDPMEDPVYRQSLAVKAKDRLPDFYGPLFKQLTLSATALDRFKDLLVEKQFARADAARAARLHGLEISDNLFFDAIVQAQRDMDRQIEALLGADGLGIYADYQKNFSKRIIVNRLAEAVRATDPLSDDQAEQLVRILVGTGGPPAHDALIGMGIDAGAGLNHPPFGVIGTVAIRQAQSILTPAQWQAMNALRAQILLEKAAKENKPPRNVVIGK